MSEQNRQAEERTENNCIHVQGSISFDEDNLSYIEYHITWHYVTSSETLTKEAYYIPVPGYADRILTAEEYVALRELLTNHPEIKSWWIKNNVLYLEVDDEEDSN